MVSQDGDYRPMSTFLATLHGMYVMSHAQEGALRKSGHSCSIDRRRDFRKIRDGFCKVLLKSLCIVFTL